MHLEVTLVFVIAVVLFGGSGFSDTYLIKTLKKDVQHYFSKQHILVCTTCHYYPLFLFSNSDPPLFFLPYLLLLIITVEQEQVPKTESNEFSFYFTP